MTCCPHCGKYDWQKPSPDVRRVRSATAGLTARQRALLDYLKQYDAIAGMCPSFDEMKDAMGLSSKSGVHRLIVALEERGFIRRLENRARAIEVLQ